MEKGRIEFDDPTFRPAKKDTVRVPTVWDKGVKEAVKKWSNDKLKWKRLANKDFPKDK